MNEESADMIIYNTCSVRGSAEDRIFGLNKKLKILKEKKPKLKIIISGCMAHYKEKELKRRLPYIDAYLPNNDLTKFKEFLLKNERAKYLPFTPKYESRFRAYVPISYGCNNFCSYCVVPYARGREICRPAEDIIDEVSRLAQNGYKEIWLLGQNVNSYQHKVKSQNPPWAKNLKNSIQNFHPLGDRPQGGKLLKNKNYIDFTDLLKIVNDIPGKFWIRFTSPHPAYFSDKLIKTMAECKKFPHYLNLPAQSGDNKILKKMKRNYTREEYINLVNKIRKAMPDIALSTDIIVGFPHETKKQFENTAKLFKKTKFDMAYISEYSPRPKTIATKLYKDNIPKEEKTRRKKELTEILAETALENNKKLIGNTHEVLIDEQKNGRLFGRTEGNKVVEIANSQNKKSKLLIGELAKAKIISATSWKLKGEFFA